MKREVFSPWTFGDLPRWQDHKICLLPCSAKKKGAMHMSIVRVLIKCSFVGMLFESTLLHSALGQGLVAFANGPTTLISTYYYGTLVQPPGYYHFGLLISSTASGPFTFSGVYATNTTPGRLGPNSYTPAVPGWSPGETMFYMVAGWSASLGTRFDPAWLTGNFARPGVFGLSAVASGVAGGGSPVPAPPFPLFGGTGLPGFAMYLVDIPEPSGLALCIGILFIGGCQRLRRYLGNEPR